MEIPSCVLKGDDSVGEFYSVAVANNAQQADTGTKMIHIGKNTKSTIISKGISAGKAQNIEPSSNTKKCKRFKKFYSMRLLINW